MINTKLATLFVAVTLVMGATGLQESFANPSSEKNNPCAALDKAENNGKGKHTGISNAKSNNCDIITIISLAGDKDSFGSEKPLGSTVSVNEIFADSTDAPFDTWCSANFQWTQSYEVPGTIINATLTIPSLDVEDNGAGDGLGGAPFDDKLFIDGVEVLNAFDDVYTPDGNANTQLPTNVSVFNLDSSFFGNLSDGTVQISVDPLGGSSGDCIALDYAELELTILANNS